MAIGIAEICKLPHEIGKQTFSDVVQQSSGYQVIPIDPASEDDKRLLRTIAQSMNNFIRISRQASTRYRANRANEAGKKMEGQIVEEMRKTELNPVQLRSSGYPDLYVTFEGRRCYIELKTSQQGNKAGTHHRVFYYSSGRKIKSDAHHLLLQVQISEEADKYWKVEYWELRDLHGLSVGLKTEWNANQQDFERAGLIVRG